MTEARDRLIREAPLAQIGSGRIWIDSPVRFISPVRRVSNGVGGVGGFSLFGSPIRQTTTMDRVTRSPLMGRRFGQENLLGVRGGRNVRRANGGGVLPSWYPRSPLQDVTTVVTAIERRRARLREGGPHRFATPLPLQGLNVLVTDESIPGAPLEHDISLRTPVVRATKGCPKPVTKILQDSIEDQDFLTPQKRLLSSIEQVEKAVREEIQRMKRTPSAKKAEREKKVRTLMSMR